MLDSEEVTWPLELLSNPEAFKGPAEACDYLVSSVHVLHPHRFSFGVSHILEWGAAVRNHYLGSGPRVVPYDRRCVLGHLPQEMPETLYTLRFFLTHR